MLQGTSELIHLTEDVVADRFRDIAIRPVVPSSHVDNKLHDAESEQLMHKMVESMMHRKTDTQGDFTFLHCQVLGESCPY